MEGKILQFIKNIATVIFTSLLLIGVISIMISLTYVSFWILLAVAIMLFIVGLFKALQARDKYSS